MKKIPILLLSILISGLLFAPMKSVSAMMEDKGTTWWTVEELLDFYQEVEQEKELECGDDLNCKMEFNFSMYDKGPKYSALESFTQGQFWITSVNPANETIKVLFFGEDMMLKHMGIEEKLSLEHLYIAWFENWKSQVYNEDYEHFYDGYLEGMHKMYAGISSIDGPDWIPAWQEVELSVAGSNLVENSQGIITFSVFAENNMFNAQGSTNYLSCLREPDYTYGTECKMYVSGDMGMSFFPPRETVLSENDDTVQSTNDNTEQPNNEAPDDTEQPNDVVTGDNNEQSTDDVADDIDENSGDEVREDSLEEIAIINQNAIENNSESAELVLSNKVKENMSGVKAPETGVNTSPCNQKTVEFPWWLVILIALGDAVIMWLFWPNRKKMKKSNKNY